jgi:hypothetical protein
MVDAYRADIPHEQEPIAQDRHASSGRPARHRPEVPEPRHFWFESPGKHSRDDDPDDAPRGGRHSLPWHD